MNIGKGDSATARNIRNGIIDYWAMLASRDEILVYRKKAPAFVDILAELFNQWEDWFLPPERRGMEELYPDPVYTGEERAAMTAFHDILDRVARQTPAGDLDAFLETPQFLELSAAAARGLETFMRQGRSPGE